MNIDLKCKTVCASMRETAGGRVATNKLIIKIYTNNLQMCKQTKKQIIDIKPCLFASLFEAHYLSPLDVYAPFRE